MSEENMAAALGLTPLSSFSEDELGKDDVDLVEIFDGEIMEDDLPVVMPDQSVENDNIEEIEFALKNVKNLISQGDIAVTELANIASQSESPGSYQVMAALIKTLLDANKEYVDISTKKRYAKEDSVAPQTNVTNNNLIMSTTELLKLMKEEKL